MLSHARNYNCKTALRPSLEACIGTRHHYNYTHRWFVRSPLAAYVHHEQT